MENLKELNSEELKQIEGGGWLADAIAEIVAALKCGCEGVFDANIASSGVGRVM